MYYIFSASHICRYVGKQLDNSRGQPIVVPRRWMYMDWIDVHFSPRWRSCNQEQVLNCARWTFSAWKMYLQLIAQDDLNFSITNRHSTTEYKFGFSVILLNWIPVETWKCAKRGMHINIPPQSTQKHGFDAWWSRGTCGSHHYHRQGYTCPF